MTEHDEGRRSISLQVEVPGTPQEVWEAIATGPGISVWFVPSEVDEREGGDGPRVFRTAVWWLFHAVCCRFRYSLWTSSGVL